MSFAATGFDQAREGAPITRHEALVRFVVAAVEVWGEKSVKRLNLTLHDGVVQRSLVTGKNSVFAALYYSHSTLPYAVGRHLVRSAPDGLYRLWTNETLLAQDDETIRKVLVHEAVHIGYANHGTEFMHVVQECGGATTGGSLAEGYKVKVEQKDPGDARYHTIKEFDSVDEAVAWGRSESLRVRVAMQIKGVPPKLWPKFRMSQ